MRGPAASVGVGALCCALVLLTACVATSSGPPPTGPARPSTASSSASPTASVPTPTVSASPSATPSTSASCSTAGQLAGWSPSRLAAQTVVAPVQESDVSLVRPLVVDGIGGVILFGSAAPPDLGASLAAVSAAAPGVRPLVMTDEEGGVVQRMANLVGWLPAPRTMAASATPAQVQRAVYAVALRMRAAGVTMDLAPVLDLDDGAGPSATDPDGTRSFSLDPAVATAYGLAFARGLAAAGIVPVAKHFPGLGRSSGNTDVRPARTLNWAQLRGAGLEPFVAAVRAGVPAVMVANASVPGLTTLPASLSPTVMTTVLRGALGFGGLVLTDSLTAGAIAAAGYPVPQAAVTALAAGADMILLGFPGPPSLDATLQAAQEAAALARSTQGAIAAAVVDGRLSRARLVSAVAHILAAKQVSLCP